LTTRWSRYPDRLAPADEFAAAEKRAIEVGLDHPVEFFGRCVGNTCSAIADPGIVDQDVGGAEFAGYRLEQARDAFFIPNVGLPNDGSSACRVHAAPALFGPASSVWKVMATFAPAFANSSAIAWPIPESEPVIRAILLSRFGISLGLRRRCSPGYARRFSSSTRIRSLGFRSDQ
jgi:hypothetical protein